MRPEILHLVRELNIRRTIGAIPANHEGSDDPDSYDWSRTERRSGGPKPDSSWQSSSACRGTDPDVFYPQTEDEAGPAKVICAACPVRNACLEFALNTNEEIGVWGGATEIERRRILRQRRNSSQY